MIIKYKCKNILTLSDTHGKHRQIPFQKVDIAIHTGDACNDGNEEELLDFFQWFAHYPAEYKIFIAGNHELLFEFEPDQFMKRIPGNIIFLENEKLFLEGLLFLSLAARPWLHVLPNAMEPQHIDFLLSHGPPKTILDNQMGCPKLLQFVTHNNPTYHLFGHIHEEGQKQIEFNKTIFINGSNFKQCQNEVTYPDTC